MANASVLLGCGTTLIALCCSVPKIATGTETVKKASAIVLLDGWGLIVVKKCAQTCAMGTVIALVDSVTANQAMKGRPVPNMHVPTVALDTDSAWEDTVDALRDTRQVLSVIVLSSTAIFAFLVSA